MSSTYSTNLRTELIGSGDQAGTWGNTTNTSLGSILEQAIAGVSGGPYISGTYPAVNFPTDADITLTANNGSVDQSRSMVLVITSSGSLTATRNVIAPASASKVYIIKNSTTGGQSIQIKYSTGTGVTIGNAQTMIVYGDGTNFYNGETALTNLTVNGNLAVSGNETISGTLAVTGATTFTGIPSGPTAGAGTNTTQLATTAFVTTAVNTATGSLGTMSTQNANNVAITGGAINGTTIGASTATTGAFTMLGGTTITASTQFSGPGTGLTGTASSLSIGGTSAGLTGTPNISVGTIASSTQALTYNSGAYNLTNVKQGIQLNQTFTTVGTYTTNISSIGIYAASSYYVNTNNSGTSQNFSFDTSGNFTAPISVSAPTLTSTVATGTAPFTVTSTTPVTNLSVGGSSTKIANTGGWSITPSGTKIYFNYNGTNVGSLDSSGNFIVSGNVTAFGTP